MSNKFRTLKPNEIEVRVASIKQNGIQLLLYKTSRTDANILDETVGPENWQCKFYGVNGVMYCSIGIRIQRAAQSTVEPYSEWVWKDDSGSEGNIEKEKSIASSSFKRAGSKWGIGRELYTAPFIWVPESACRIQSARGKYVCYDDFSVADMSVKDGKIAYLKIVNETLHRVCYERGRK